MLSSVTVSFFLYLPCKSFILCSTSPNQTTHNNARNCERTMTHNNTLTLNFLICRSENAISFTLAPYTAFRLYPRQSVSLSVMVLNSEPSNPDKTFFKFPHDKKEIVYNSDFNQDSFAILAVFLFIVEADPNYSSKADLEVGTWSLMPLYCLPT